MRTLRINKQIRDYLIRNRTNLTNKNKNFEKTLNQFKFINVQKKYSKVEIQKNFNSKKLNRTIVYRVDETTNQNNIRLFNTCFNELKRINNH